MIKFAKGKLLALLERRAIFTGPSMDLEWSQGTCFGNLAIQAPPVRIPAALSLAPCPSPAAARLYHRPHHFKLRVNSAQRDLTSPRAPLGA